MTLARPCSGTEALARMEALKGLDMPYELGTGGYDARHPLDPCTTHGRTGKRGADCAGVAQSYAFKIPRHDPGFAAGMAPALYRDQSDVDDDHNTNSAIEDALTNQEVYELVLEGPVLPADLLAYATLRIKAADGEEHVFIGHVAMIKFVPEGWKLSDGYHVMRILQCCGPNDRRPLVIETDGSLFDRHDHNWPKLQHRTQILRVKQR